MFTTYTCDWLDIISSENSLFSFNWHQAIIWINAGVLLIEPLTIYAMLVNTRVNSFVSLCFDKSQQDELSGEHTENTNDL